MSQVDAADHLDAERIRATLHGQLIGNRVIVLKETTSTNDVVAELAAESVEGLVVFAERQTAGRGQYGRRWESAPHKGLWLSILLRPAIAVTDSGKLTDILSQAIATAVAEMTGLPASIKPPNDIYIGNRKVAGVLVEMRVEAGGNYCAIAGAGINVNQSRVDFPAELRETASSLAICLGHSVERHALAVALLRTLDSRYSGLSESSAARAAS